MTLCRLHESLKSLERGGVYHQDIFMFRRHDYSKSYYITCIAHLECHLFPITRSQLDDDGIYQICLPLGSSWLSRVVVLFIVCAGAVL